MKTASLIKTFALLLGLTPILARADVVVLVHGWAANADTWRFSGVSAVLDSNGWADAGVLVPAPGGAAVIPGPGAGLPGDQAYRAQLSAEAPLLYQAGELFAELQQVRRLHPHDTLTLVGHSAGGLVARLVLARSDAPKVSGLVTIATPNLGTVRALQGLDLVDSKPFFCPGPGINFLKRMSGGDSYEYLEDSRPALVDMTPAVPGNLLAWLNQQPLPDITYHAIIHELPGTGGYQLVPAFSQDLNQVPTLRGKAQISVTASGHGLTPADGNLLVEFLAH